MNDNFEIDFEAFLKAQKLWEAQQFGADNGNIKDAKECLTILSERINPGPSTFILLDLKNSMLLEMAGDFKGALGMDFQKHMPLERISAKIKAEHNNFIATYFPTYLEYILSLPPQERSRVGYSMQFIYKNNQISEWMNQRVFKTFNDSNGSLRYAILEYTQISSVKKDEVATFNVYDKDIGYIVNESLHPASYIIDELTPSEIAIARLTALGKSDQEIGEINGVSTGTIKQHKKHIFTKLGIHKSTELVALIYQSGLLNGVGKSNN